MPFVLSDKLRQKAQKQQIMTIGYPQIHQSVVTEKGFMKTRALYSYLQMQAKQYHDDDNPQTDACGSAVFGLRDMEPFPVILHRMLGEMVKEGTEHIISWNDDGKSFTIHDPKDFADTILTRYFTNQTRYKSFQVRIDMCILKL